MVGFQTKKRLPKEPEVERGPLLRKKTINLFLFYSFQELISVMISLPCLSLAIR